MRIAEPFSRLVRRLWFLAACLGVLVVAVLAGGPLLGYWTTALSTSWGDERGDVLIVLGGDFVAPDVIGQSSYLRCFYGVRVWRGGHYRTMVVTGKDAAPLMRDFMVSQGVPAPSVLVENAATSTRENALYVAALLHGNTGRKVLLTSDFHMKRALGAFRKAGIDASPLPIPDARKRVTDWAQRWDVFWALIQETVKLGYYKARNWT